MTYESLQTKFKNLIDNNAMSTFQIIIVGICFVLNMNDGIDVLVVSFSGSEIMKEWGLDKTQMGYIYSAGLTGMTIGAFFLAPFADRIGRRKMFLIALCLISFGMLLVSISAAFWQMLCLRFITGLGIGGILPTMTATAAEFSNNKRRDFSVSLVQAGWPVGAIITGFFCAYAIPIYGWRFGFMLAGSISLLMLIGVFFYMTDSIEFLVQKQPKNALSKLNFILDKMGHQTIESLPEKAKDASKPSVQSLFTPLLKADTIKFWVGAFFGFLTLYTIMSWVPTIAKDSGMPFELATYVGIALNVGAAVGSSSIGAIGSKFGLRQTVLFFMICAFSVMMIYANISLTTTLIFICITLIGVFVQGGFNGIWPTLARVYPAEIRTTGVGFTVGIGRFGAILGPVIFGVLSDAGLSISSLFIIFSLPLLVMGACIFSLKSKNLG